MKYVKAQKVLPEQIIKVIQEYIDGEFLYIPRKDGKHKSWGEMSGSKDNLKERNNQIYRKYKDGSTVANLSTAYYLSEQSIRRIISQEKACFLNSLHNHL